MLSARPDRSGARRRTRARVVPEARQRRKRPRDGERGAPVGHASSGLSSLNTTPARAPPSRQATRYTQVDAHEARPDNAMSSATAGLIAAPEIGRPPPPRENREIDGEPLEVVVGVVLRGRDVQHHEGEGEREQQLRDEHLPDQAARERGGAGCR